MRAFRLLLSCFLILSSCRSPAMPSGGGRRLGAKRGSADWSSTGMLPAAASVPEAKVMLLAARVGRWRGIFAEHCWVLIKDRNGEWERYDVVGWGQPVRRNHRVPDGRWYGNAPRIFAEASGAEAEAMIPAIRSAIASYPWRRNGEYRVWPGPNSNSFIPTCSRRAGSRPRCRTRQSARPIAAMVACSA